MEIENITLDELNTNRAKKFFENYIYEHIITDSGRKTYLGENKKTCRFCLQSNPIVKFRTDAHAIPQFIGNKNLLSNFECDNCNALFSKYETAFSNYLGIARSFTYNKLSKNKFPRFINKKSGLEINFKDNRIQLSTINENKTLNIDYSAKTLEIHTERPSYIPLFITKLLIKIGYSMLDESDLVNFEKTRKFITENHNNEIYKDLGILSISGYFIPGNVIYTKPLCILLTKKEINIELPTKIVVFNFYNYCFQIMLPFSDLDKNLIGKTINYPFFPLLIDSNYFKEHGNYETFTLNFTSHEVEKGQPHKLKFSFDFIEKPDIK